VNVLSKERGLEKDAARQGPTTDRSADVYGTPGAANTPYRNVPSLAARSLLRSGFGEAILAVLLLLAILTTSREDYLLAGATACLYAIAATGLGVALGLAGEFMIAQVFIFAVAAYATGSLTANHSWSFWTAVPAGAGLATVVGIAYSLVGLRVSQFYFAMIGFFVVAIIPDLCQIFSAQTGGSVGLPVPDVPNFFGATVGAKGIFILAAILLLVTVIVVKNLRRSPLGVEMRRLRDDPVGLTMSGIPVWRTRLTTYLICSILAGVSGAVYSHVDGYLQPTTFSISLAILFFAAVLIGGRTTLWGPIIGVSLLYLIPNTVLDIPQDSDLIYGGMVFIAIIGIQGGLFARLIAAVRTHVPGVAVVKLGSRSGASSFRAAASSAGPSPFQDGAEAQLADSLDRLRKRPTMDPGDGINATGLRKEFGAVKALDLGDKDSVRVEPGRVHLLIGANGSGKTTLLNTLCGLIQLDAGTVRLGSHDFTNRGARRIATAGIGRSFQSPKLSPELTPVDLLSARISRNEHPISFLHWFLGDWVARRRRSLSDAGAAEIAAAAGLGAAAFAPCVGLTSGQRRIVDVLLALTCASDVVLLDEPAAGLSGIERARLVDTIVALCARGMGFLVVEHDLDLALGLANTVTVLSHGQILAQGPPAEIQSNKEVRRVLMGEGAWEHSA
jgi:branched-chain amino acid transport system permease protein